MSDSKELIASPLTTLLANSPHPSAPLALHSELKPIVAPGGQAALVYAQRRCTVLVPLGPMGDRHQGAQLLRNLTDDRSVRTVIITQTRESDLPLVRSLGFKSEVFGRNYSIYLPHFTDRGKPLAKVRQNIHRAAREGVTVREVPLGDQLSSIVAAVTADWIRQKGSHTKKLKLLVGEDKPINGKASRAFVAYKDGTAVAFVMYSAAAGESDRWLYDLTRRTVEAPTGTIEAINMTALRTLADEGSKWLHLGLTPFVGVSSETILNESRRLSLLMRTFASHGEHFYPARDQERFKLKWNPHVVEPEFISVYPSVRAGSLYGLMRLTNMI